MVPPHTGNIQCVARFQFRHLSSLYSLAKPGMRFKVRVTEVNHRYCRSTRSQVQRTGVQILNLIWRKKSKFSGTGHTAGKVSLGIEVARSRGFTPYPKAI